jgi:hypothetical protein
MPGKEGFRWFLGSLGVAVLLLAGYWMRGHAQPTVAQIPVHETARTVAPEISAPRHVVTSPPPANGAEKQIEICGFGKVSLPADDYLVTYEFLAPKTRRAAQRWQSALLSSDNYRARAAGLFLEGKIAQGTAVEPMTEQTRDALAQLAAGAQDPVVYALAVNACGRGDENPALSACAQISPQAWARLDPDNAEPWLMLVERARRAKDTDAEAYAFAQAAKAHRDDSWSDSLFELSESLLPGDVTPLERWYFATQVFGVAAAAFIPYQATFKHCSDEAMRDGSVRQQCADLADLMVTKGTTLLDFSLGIRLGSRAGWPAQRVDALRQQFNAMMQTLVQAGSDENEPWSCRSVERGNAYASLRTRLGEVGAAHEAVERSGESVPELAQKWQEYIDKAHRDDQQRPAALPEESVP